MKRHILGLILFILTLCVGLFVSLSGAENFRIQLSQGVPDTPAAEETLKDADRVPIAQNPTLTSKDGASDREETRIESFSDDRRIGRRGKNKIELRCFSNSAGRFAELKFYSRTEYGSWLEVQSFKFQKDGVTDCSPIIEDFNNDGLKDFTYESNVAARGANEIRTLLIYNPKKDELIHIKNSAEYPNLAYNKKLNCIDAWLFHGATTTVFLRQEGDMLREFASVDTGAERVVTITRRSSKRVIIRRQPMHEDEVYTRYSTFDPPT